MQEIKQRCYQGNAKVDKNLNVTNKNIPFFHCLRDNLACVPGVPKGLEKEILGA